MKLFFAMLIFVGCHSAFAAQCPDISAQYKSIFDVGTTSTTVIYQQGGCDSLAISGFSNSDHPPYVKVFDLVPFSLKGISPGPMDCLNAAPMVCATYEASSKSIVKTLDPVFTSPVTDPVHGLCFYTVSNLSKDTSGNLIEQPIASSCDDGYTGPVKAFTFLKQP